MKNLILLWGIIFGLHGQDSIVDQYECDENILVEKQTGKLKIEFPDGNSCSKALNSSKHEVICRFFDMNDKNIGPGARPATGWRPSNIKTLTGLGRYPYPSFEKCLKGTESASAKFVCTNTGGDHYKSTHVNSNLWCGSSVLDEYCFSMNPKSQDDLICSYPSDGLGKYDGWMLTKVTDKCHYQVPKLSYQQCQDKLIKTQDK